jgi:phosphoesterase RecJ-like protein
MTENNFAALTLAEAAERLLAAEGVLIFIHQNPDGDAVGSGFALAQILRSAGKKARVVCGDEIPRRLRFLMRGQEDCTYSEELETEYPLLCSVDTASTMQLGKLGALAEKITVAIDHHGMNEPYCDNCTVPTAAAAGELIYDLYRMLCDSGTIRPDGDICRLLYSALVSDTGSFKFANTTKETLLRAADMLEEINRCTDGGDDTAMLCHRLFECRTMTELYAQKAGIDALRLSHNGELGVVLFTKEMVDAAGITYEDISNIVGLPRTVDGVKIALAIKQSESDPTEWRVSSRASCCVDVSAVCASFGGGGHKRAAGCTVTAPDAETAYARITEAFGRALEEAEEQQ